MYGWEWVSNRIDGCEDNIDKNRCKEEDYKFRNQCFLSSLLHQLIIINCYFTPIRLFQKLSPQFTQPTLPNTVNPNLSLRLPIQLWQYIRLIGVTKSQNGQLVPIISPHFPSLTQFIDKLHTEMDQWYDNDENERLQILRTQTGGRIELESFLKNLDGKDMKVKMEDGVANYYTNRGNRSSQYVQNLSTLQKCLTIKSSKHSIAMVVRWSQMGQYRTFAESQGTRMDIRICPQDGNGFGVGLWVVGGGHERKDYKGQQKQQKQQWDIKNGSYSLYYYQGPYTAYQMSGKGRLRNLYLTTTGHVQPYTYRPEMYRSYMDKYCLSYYVGQFKEDRFDGKGIQDSWEYQKLIQGEGRQSAKKEKTKLKDLLNLSFRVGLSGWYTFEGNYQQGQRINGKLFWGHTCESWEESKTAINRQKYQLIPYLTEPPAIIQFLSDPSSPNPTQSSSIRQTHFTYVGQLSPLSQLTSQKCELTFPNHSVYAGPMTNSILNGTNCTYKTANSLSYEGDYRDGEKCGNGKIVNCDGTIAYEGMFQKGLPHGRGIVNGVVGNWVYGVDKQLLD